MELTTILDALQTVLVLVLPVIGITGGLKGLIGGLPAFSAGGITVPGGLWFSWCVALAWVLARVLFGLEVPPEGTNAASWIAAQWALVAATANVVRNWITG